jgi:hypothetical protein
MARRYERHETQAVQTMSRRLQEHAPLVAAVLNGILVLLLPALLVLLAHGLLRPLDTSCRVRATETPLAETVIQAIWYGSTIMLPFAFFAGWRTWVHAKRWQRNIRTWRGLAEAFVLGATYLFIGFLATAQSWPVASILAFGFYAVLGGIVGLLVGALLHANAFLVLTLLRARRYNGT